jgi:hypothetical protein
MRPGPVGLARARPREASPPPAAGRTPAARSVWLGVVEGQPGMAGEPAHFPPWPTLSVLKPGKRAVIWHFLSTIFVVSCALETSGHRCDREQQEGARRLPGTPVKRNFARSIRVFRSRRPIVSTVGCCRPSRREGKQPFMTTTWSPVYNSIPNGLAKRLARTASVVDTKLTSASRRA